MKRVFLAVIFCFLLSSVAMAAEVAGLVGAAVGYLSTSSNVAVVFNASAGQSLLLTGFPMEYTSTVGFCGLGRAGLSGLIVTNYSTSMVSSIAPANDLYLYLCMKYSGASGDFLPLVMNSAYYSINAQEMKAQENEYIPEELLKAVEEAIDHKFDR